MPKSDFPTSEDIQRGGSSSLDLKSALPSSPETAESAFGSSVSAEVNLASPEHGTTPTPEPSPTPSGWNAEHGALGVSAHDFSYSPELSPEVAEDERQAWERLRGEQPKSEPAPELERSLEPPRAEVPVIPTPVLPPEPVLSQPAIGPRVGFIPLGGSSSEPPEPPVAETTWSQPEERRFFNPRLSMGWIILLALLVGGVAGYGAVKSRVLGEQMKANLEALETKVQTEVREITHTVTEVKETVTTLESTVPIPGPAGEKGEAGATGLQGPTGLAGATGPTGASGDPCSACVFLQGSTPGVQQAGSFNISGSGIIGSSLQIGTVGRASTVDSNPRVVTIYDETSGNMAELELGSNSTLSNSQIGRITFVDKAASGEKRLALIDTKIRNSGTDLGGELQFTVKPAGGSHTAMLRIAASGVGLGSIDWNSIPPSATLHVAGNALFKNATDSATAFQIQNAAGTNTVLRVDTTSTNRVTLGTNTPGNAATIAIDSNTGYLQIQGSASSDGSGGGGVFLVGDSNPTIQSGRPIAGDVQFQLGAATSAYGFKDYNTGARLFSLTNTGQAIFKNSANSTTAFQVQNAAGNNYLLVDTSGASVAVGNTSIASTIQIGNTTGAVAQTINIGNNSTASSTTNVNIGSLIGNSSTNIEGSSAGGIGIGSSASSVPIVIGNNTGSTLLTLRAGSGGIVIGAGGIANPIQIGNTTGAVTQTINIGNNATAGSTNSLVLGSTIGTSPTTIQAGTSGVLVKPADSTTAFQIQGAGSASLFSADTSGMNLTLNGANGGEIQAWQTNSTPLPAATMGQGTVTLNGYVYSLGGYNGSAFTTTYYAKLGANGSVGSWTSTTALPDGRFWFTGATANGYVYVIGGDRNASPTTQTTVYYSKANADGTLGTWRSGAPLPAPREMAGTVVANGYIYVIGGGATQTASAQSTVYYAKLNADGSVGSWTTNANPLPLPRMAGSAVVANGYVYLLGGGDTTATTLTYYASLNATDGSIGTWSTTTALPTASAEHTSVVANGYVYVMGGHSAIQSTGTIFNTVYYAPFNSNGTLGSWSTSASPLPALRVGHSSALSNGYIYTLGGSGISSQGSASATVYYASTSRIKVGGSLDLVGLGGQNLSDGGTGGSLTAGNTEIIGSLGVRGGATFMQGVSIDKELVVSGSALFRNADGATLLGVDNSNSQLTVTNIQSTGVITGVNGAASVQLKSQLASATGLTMSGNEITDTKRSTATAGDGRAAPDSSTGIWEATTNLVSNGGLETNTTGWGVSGATSIIRDTGIAKFGLASLKVTSTGGGYARFDNAGVIPASASTTYTASLWVKGTAGASFPLRFESFPDGGTVFTANTTVMSGVWQKITATLTTGASATGMLLYAPNSPAANIFWIDGVQIEQQPIATPYVETNGATASRSDSRVQAPVALVDETQAWVALRLRPGVDFNNTGHFATLFNLADGGANFLYLSYNPGSNRFEIRRAASSASSAYATYVATPGTPVTVIAAWDAGNIKVSVDGSAFASAANTFIPILATTTFDIGSPGTTPGFGAYGAADADVFWFASGTGTLTNADAATINRFGNGDPRLSSFPSTTSPTMTWDGATKDYEGTDSAAVAKSTLILDDTNLYRESTGQLTTDSALKIKSTSTTAFQIQSGTGTALLIADTQGMTITLGSASVTPVLLVLGNKNTAGDPTCDASKNGAIYYNSNSSQFRGCTGSSWTSLGENKPAARVYHSVDQNLALNTITVIAFNSERFDTDLIHDTATNNSRLTAKTASKYMITGQVTWATTEASGNRVLHIRLNGTTYVGVDGRPMNGENGSQSITTTYDLAANDYVELVAYHNGTGVATSIKALGNYSPEFSMTKVAD